MRQLKDLGLIIAYELHGFRIYLIHSALKNLFSYPAKAGSYFLICIAVPIMLGFVVNKIISQVNKIVV